MYTHPTDTEVKATPQTGAESPTTRPPASGDRPRWVLHFQALVWRRLMGIGMLLHFMAPPRPPKPAFVRRIPSTLSGKTGTIDLHFYVPRDYETQKALWQSRSEAEDGQPGEEGRDTSGPNPARKRSLREQLGQSWKRRSMSARRWGQYPVVINFHGGGFTLGSGTDDARFCGTVVDECHAVVVSVDFRLAPENPFPTAVEDGVDAVLWIHAHALELGIDREKMALSGFSSGGNMTFTVSLRLYDEMMGFPRDGCLSRPPTPGEKAERAMQGTSSARVKNTGDGDDEQDQVERNLGSDEAAVCNTDTRPARSSSSKDVLSSPPVDPKPAPSATITELNDCSSAPIQLAALMPWYPSVDYTRTREQRRATNVRKDQELPSLFTTLFDSSYLHPPGQISLDSPYLSCGVAPTSLLRAALPSEIIMHTCEWDMLLDEAEIFRDRLTSSEIGKHVFYYMVPGVPHGWDKAPNPIKPTPGVREHYLRACKELRRVFSGVDAAKNVNGGPRPTVERLTTAGWPTAADSEAVNLVR